MELYLEDALKWALKQQYSSVAARYARKLAEEVVRLRQENTVLRQVARERICPECQRSDDADAFTSPTSTTKDTKHTKGPR